MKTYASYTIRSASEQDGRRDMISRSMTVRAATLDVQGRSVEAVMATDAPVTVFDWNEWEPIDEVLLAEGGEFPTQIPLLANHDRTSLDSVLGSVRGIRRDGSQWVGRMTFAEGDPDAERAWNKVKQGHLTDVSIGYRAVDFEDIQPGQSREVFGKTYTAGERRMRITRKWSTRELSVVPVGADRGAKVRTEPTPAQGARMKIATRRYLESLGLRADATEAQAQAFLSALGGEQARKATDLEAGKITLEQAMAAPAAAAAPEVRGDAASTTAGTAAAAAPGRSDEAIRAEAIRVERERVRAIREAAGNDIPAELLNRAIDEAWTTERANAEFLGHVRESRAGIVKPENAPVISAGRSAATAMSLGLAIAMMGNLRSDTQLQQWAKRNNVPDWAKAAQQAHEFRRMSMVDMCREAIAMDRHECPRGTDDIVRTAVSGGSLSNIFTSSVNAMLMAAFEEEVDTTDWCDESEVADFKPNTAVKFAGNAAMKKLARGKQAEHADAEDSAETFKVARFAKQFVLDEQDWIDDSMGALFDMPVEFGRSCRRLRPSLIYAILVLNPTMADTGALFNSTALTTAGGHANYAADATTSLGGPLAAGTLQLAITKMKEQYRMSGKAKIGKNITPGVLLTPPALEWTGRQLLRAGSAGGDTFNVLQGVLDHRVERRLGTSGDFDPDTEVAYAGLDTNYYLVSREKRHMKVAYRRGTNRSPQIRAFTLDKGQWGLGWDVVMDIGAKAIDYCGIFKAKGAAA